jgi:hypothetical protein
MKKKKLFMGLVFVPWISCFMLTTFLITLPPIMVMQIAEIFPWAEKPLAKWILGVDPSSPGVIIHYGGGGSDSGGEGGNGIDPGGGGGGEKSREEAGASGKT